MSSRRHNRYEAAIRQFFDDVARVGRDGAPAGVDERGAIRAILTRLHDGLPDDAPERQQIRLVIDAPIRFPLAASTEQGKAITEAFGPAFDSTRLVAHLSGVMTGLRLMANTVPQKAASPAVAQPVRGPLFN